jgi:hypothetical protein
MKNKYDENIQQALEEGTQNNLTGFSPAEQEALRAYSDLILQLRKTPEGGFSFQFTSKVTRALQQKRNRSGDIQFYSFAAASFFIAFVPAFLAAIFPDQKIAIQLLTVFLDYKWVIVPGLLTYLLVQLLDQKLLKEEKEQN